MKRETWTLPKDGECDSPGDVHAELVTAFGS